MKQIIFHFETITPMFFGGVDGESWILRYNCKKRDE